MAKNPEIPLHLCQVLEEEFENLHQMLDVGLEDRIVFRDDDGSTARVVVKKDWNFHEGHVRPDVLAERLRNVRQERSRVGGSAKAADARTDLAAYLVDHTGLLAALEKGEGYIEILRAVLTDADRKVFKKARFERLSTLRGETRALLELGWPGDKIEFGGGDDMKGDRARFKRLLLEEAFPGAIRRVYDLRSDRVFQRTHGLKTKRSALCFSGGGIRSGTFALGVLQSLARRRLLGQFDYLSTVSGGGYIGGWLSAWIHRHPEGLQGVVKDLGGDARGSKLEPEPEPLRHLRDYSSFITPRTGILSADSWTFVVIYIRNLLLNWVVLIPLLASVLLIPRVSVAVVLAAPGWSVLAGLLLLGSVGIILLKPDWRLGLWLAAADVLLILILLFSRASVGGAPQEESSWNAPTAMFVAGTILGGYALAYMRLNRPSNSGAIRPGSFWAKHRDQQSFLWLCLLPLSIAASLLTTFWAWFRTLAHNTESPVVFILGRSGLCSRDACQFSELIGFLIYGALLGFTAWALYIIFAALSGVFEHERMTRGGGRQGGSRIAGVMRNAGWELLVTFAASVIGAILLYAVAVNVPYFHAPVVDPLAASAQGGAARLPPSSDWWGAEIYACLAFPVYLLLFFVGITLFTGFTSRRSEHAPEPHGSKAKRKPGSTPVNFDIFFIEDEDREWLARASAWVFIAAAGWLLLSALVIFGPLLLFKFPKLLPAVGGVSGLVTYLGGRSSRTPGQSKGEGGQSILETLGVNMIVVAAFVFVAFLVVLVSFVTGALIPWLVQHLPAFPKAYWGTGGLWDSARGLLEISRERFDLFKGKYPTNPENVFRGLHFPTMVYLLGLAIALQVFGRIGSRLINLNKFSLHAGYRDRIIRAFLGASRLKGERRENPFTGFDPRDNLYMEEMRPWLLRESDFRRPGGLARFVALLHRPDSARADAAKYLRRRIGEMDGESRRYFRDPSESIEFNPSFRSALFADLGRIMQDYSLGEAEEFKGVLARAEAAYQKLDPPRGDERLMLNRMVLTEVFKDCIEYPPPPYRLMHVVNMTLNLVGGKRLAWQQRRAESFTSTPLHSGSLFVGYRRTREYGGRSGISLGTAVATSGAAASSNMGYFSPSPFVTLVLTFFNARLGWWLGNPGVYGADTYFRSHPQKALSPILDEAFGLTDDTNPYVLLSDGGHFENLGLYEMVLRRCRHIVVVDGSADPQGNYDDLGGAVRKIRIDLGIPIEFQPRFLILSRPESEKKQGAYVAIGDIHYEYADGELGGGVGKLVYIKPAVYFTEPRDIVNYAKAHPDFPHESTADQFFDEPQFESHRMLGFYILEQLCESISGGGGLDGLQNFVYRLVERGEAEQRKSLGEKG